MRIVRRIEIDYGHTLPDHFGFCNQIHGHRGAIECHFEGCVNNEVGETDNGMVMDFKICKKVMMSTIHEELDHGFAIWKNHDADKATVYIHGGSDVYDLSTLEFIRSRNDKILELDQPPTAEVLANYFFKKIEKQLEHLDSFVKLVELHWWETPNNRAIVNAETKY